MAISLTHYTLLRQMHAAKMLPQRGSILEIGEANWYGGPLSENHLSQTIQELTHGERRETLGKELRRLCDEDDGLPRLFGLAKLVYRLLFDTTDVTAIDLHGTPAALKLDLNAPLELDRQFDCVINHGTAEHIFNIARVFVSMHEATKPGGLMIHESPFTGWIDHGFYCLQPTLFLDLARANDYTIKVLAIEVLNQSIEPIKSREELLALAKSGDVPDNAMLFVAMKKGGDGPFRVPMQGFYAGAISDEARQAWRELR